MPGRAGEVTAGSGAAGVVTQSFAVPPGLPYIPVRLAIGRPDTGSLQLVKLTNTGYALLRTNPNNGNAYHWKQGVFETLASPLDLVENSFGWGVTSMNDAGTVVGGVSFISKKKDADDSLGSKVVVWSASGGEPAVAASFELPAEYTNYHSFDNYAYAVDNQGQLYGAFGANAASFTSVWYDGLVWANPASTPGRLGSGTPSGTLPFKYIERQSYPSPNGRTWTVKGTRNVIDDSTEDYGPTVASIEGKEYTYGSGFWPVALNDAGRYIGYPMMEGNIFLSRGIAWSETNQALTTLSSQDQPLAINASHTILGMNPEGHPKLWRWVRDVNGNSKYSLSAPLLDTQTFQYTRLTQLNDSNVLGGHTQVVSQDAQGKTTTTGEPILLVPAELAVDTNRDGVITLASDLNSDPTLSDQTSKAKPYRFWSNDDDDGVDTVGYEIFPSARKDSQDSYISNNRDLEDFARIHLYIGGLQDALTGVNPTLKVGLKWKNVTSGAPSIRVFRTPAAQLGSADYLKTEAAGTALRTTANALTTALLVSGTSSVMLPVSFLDSLTATQPKAWFVFEGVTEGKGQLVITINKADGTEIGEGPGVWLDIANVKSMYERAVVTPSQINDPYDHTNVVPPPAMSWARDDNGFSFIPAKDEAKTYIIFVHGWNVSYESHIHKFAETTFKRLWQRGYKGRFVAFRWPTYSGGIVPDHYNQSEYRAWKSGESLKQLINQLPSGYTRNLVAHSMGNIVAGSALQKGASVANYALLNAAVPAMCYDESTGLRQSWNYVTPNDDSDSVTKKLAYTGQLKNVAGNLVNFYLTNDEATSTLWELNNYQFKPQNQIVFSGVRGYYYGPNAALGKKLWVDFSIAPLRILTDKDESMAFACQSVTKTAGADGRAAGAINDSVDMDDYGFQAQHSAQWERTFQQTAPFFDELLNKLGLPTLP